MKAKLIYQSNISYLPTNLPARFLGLPDGKVYVVYERFFKSKTGRTELEFVFGVHKEFSFDFDKEKLYANNSVKSTTPVYFETVDKINPKIRTFKVYQMVRSFAEAIKILDKKAEHIINRTKLMKGEQIRLVGNEYHRQTASA